MKIVILDAKTLGECDLSPIEKFGEFKIYQTTTPEETLTRSQDADIILTNKVVLDASVLQKLPKLKLICVTATGTNIIDMKTAQEKGIVVKNVAGYSTNSVAQHTLTLALNLLSKLDYYDHYCKSAQWCKSDVFMHINGGLNELDGKKWGIIGLGSIGKKVASLAGAFGANISYASTSGKNLDKTYLQKPLKNLLEESDIISIHAPLNENTKNLICKKELSLLKENAILINVGRGGIVNESDIAMTLQSKNIYFATDVLEKEPMDKNHPFLNPSIQEKMILTPHIAWAYGNARETLIKMVIENIKTFVQGTL
ncbi:D-2-hydroxyacid dehydrogenase [Helicobacter cappadocius]|uniref:D-2-hydroxyacid dehydrogenase n=1 Tax=Helicobacter cappadocius TaxID=3063998 RepID=A0AA90SS38_9HELI|nr:MULTISPECIES: D-2-hydroxyacid dehydrogenase [unclassified Helicobacter]MDO7252637.1 D-2-hydroxyacid dehydrogenase [Helicobacter sp. faydin-H75]MDP2538504.1 D-2-hydroxyacid dehydrogenase [Helicobacter sp. faydin-H76]